MMSWKEVILKTIGMLFFYACFLHMCFGPDHIESGYVYYTIIEEIVNKDGSISYIINDEAINAFVEHSIYKVLAKFKSGDFIHEEVINSVIEATKNKMTIHVEDTDSEGMKIAKEEVIERIKARAKVRLVDEIPSKEAYFEDLYAQRAQRTHR